MAGAVFLLMPEWQGSPSSRAMMLTEGAAALREDLPASATREVPVPTRAGDSMGTPVARLSSLLRAREAAAEVLSEVADSGAGSAPIIVGGDCASSLVGLQAAMQGEDPLAVLWFDAHPDLQHPSTSPSGAASGMALRHALGDGVQDLASRTPLDPRLLTLVGTRAIDPEESREIEQHGIAVIGAALDADPAAFAETVRARVAALVSAHGARRLYVHVDLDVLDPAEFASVHTAEPFGLTVAQLTAAIRAAGSELSLVGATISEFAPASMEAAREDLPTVLRVLAALTSGLSAR